MVSKMPLTDDEVEALIDERINARLFGEPLLTRPCECGSREVMLEFRLRDCNEHYSQAVFKCDNCYDIEAFTFTAGATLGEIVCKWNRRNEKDN